MSFYGNIKRVQSSPFVFDKYYPNRAAMENAASTDNVYIGRYVLVKYTYSEDPIYIEKGILSSQNYKANTYYYKSNNDYILDTNSEVTENRTYYELTHYFNKYKKDEDSSDPNGKKISEYYQNNVDIDIQKYTDTFDGTVWQKIYTHVTDDNNNDNFIEKYIMIAELNSAVPRLELDVISPKYIDNNWNEQWIEPQILEMASSENAYTFQMPNILHLDVGEINSDFYAKDLIDPECRYVMYKDGTSSKEARTGEEISHKDMLNPDYNYMKWTNYKLDNNKEKVYELNQNDSIDGKELETKLYAFGQVISDIYDVLYGVPAGGTGRRPFYTDDLASILSNYDKGLVGILTSLTMDIKGNDSEDLYNRDLQPGMYYYLTSKWCSAEEDPDSFIENIPRVIGSSNELSQGKCDYRLNFQPDEGNSYLTRQLAESH